MINQEMLNHIDKYFESINTVIKLISRQSIMDLSKIMQESIKNKKNVFIAGNGGSASNASHICGDYLKSFYNDDYSIKIHCLSDNQAAFSAISNDYSFEFVFEEQLKRLASNGDVFIGMSGSGNSSNIIKAIETSKKMGVYAVGISAFSGGMIKNISDLHIHIPINDMELAEDFQLILFHLIKQYISNVFFGKQIQGDKYISRLYNKVK